MSRKYLRVSALLSRSCLRQLMRKAPQLGFQLAQQCSCAQARLPHCTLTHRSFSRPSGPPSERCTRPDHCSNPGSKEGHLGVGNRDPTCRRSMSFVHAAQFSQDCPRCHLRKLALRGDLLPYWQFSSAYGNVHLKRVSLRVIRGLCFPSFHWTHSANRSKDRSNHFKNKSSH